MLSFPLKDCRGGGPPTVSAQRISSQRLSGFRYDSSQIPTRQEIKDRLSNCLWTGPDFWRHCRCFTEWTSATSSSFLSIRVSVQAEREPAWQSAEGRCSSWREGSCLSTAVCSTPYFRGSLEDARFSLCSSPGFIWSLSGIGLATGYQET